MEKKIGDKIFWTWIAEHHKDEAISLLVGDNKDENYELVWLSVEDTEELIKDLQQKVRKIKAEQRRKYRNEHIFEAEFDELTSRAKRLGIKWYNI